jgi:hypothetical protein
MKIVRVPWIRCRADEVDSCVIQVQWRKQEFLIMAQTPREAEGWWDGLPDAERDQVTGIESSEMEQSSFW